MLSLDWVVCTRFFFHIQRIALSGRRLFVPRNLSNNFMAYKVRRVGFRRWKTYYRLRNGWGFGETVAFGLQVTWVIKRRYVCVAFVREELFVTTAFLVGVRLEFDQVHGGHDVGIHPSAAYSSRNRRMERFHLELWQVLRWQLAPSIQTRVIDGIVCKRVCNQLFMCFRNGKSYKNTFRG